MNVTWLGPGTRTRTRTMTRKQVVQETMATAIGYSDYSRPAASKQLAATVLADRLGGYRTPQGVDRSLVETARPRMCFLGRTASGKTLLLNSLMKRRILPQSEDPLAVTSTVTVCA